MALYSLAAGVVSLIAIRGVIRSDHRQMRRALLLWDIARMERRAPGAAAPTCALTALTGADTSPPPPPLSPPPSSAYTLALSTCLVGVENSIRPAELVRVRLFRRAHRHFRADGVLGQRRRRLSPDRGPARRRIRRCRVQND
ncbi:MAG: hypothetical protein BJ554DRAFT_3039, partial [Olpidium bornovanus]